MRKKGYKRQKGDMEIRILKDGRIVMVAPDQEMLEIAENLREIQEGSQKEHNE